jgi:hypothetical protein
VVSLQRAIPLLLLVLAYRSSWGHGFVSDAKFLIQHNSNLEHWGQLWENLSHDYFWSSAEIHIPYWRPVTKAGWLAVACLFGKSAAAFHAYLLAWFAIGVVGVDVLARRLGASGWWSCFAATLYVLHPVAIEPASLIMATSDVICASAGLWTLIAGLRWLRGGSWAWAAAHVAMLALALGSKEVGILLPPLLTLWVLLEARNPHGTSMQVWRLAPAWVLTLVYLILRALVLGDGKETSLTFDPLRIFVGIGSYFWALIPFRIDAGLRSLSVAEALSVPVLLKSAVVWVVIAGFSATFWFRRAATPLVLLAWCVASCLIVLLPDDLNVPGASGKVALALRWALQAAAASSILFAMGLQFVARKEPKYLSKTVAAMTGLWAMASVSAASVTHAPYRDAHTMVEHEEWLFEATPEAYRTADDLCRHHDRVVIRWLSVKRYAEALRVAETIPAGCTWDRDRKFNLFSLLMAHGEFERAEPLLFDLLQDSAEDRRSDGELLLLGTRLMIEKGDLDAADAMLLEARKHGIDERHANVLQEILTGRRVELSERPDGVEPTAEP